MQKKPPIVGMVNSIGQHSLARKITLVMVMIVILVSVASLSFNWVIVSKDNEKEFIEKSDEYSSYLQESLELPLWNYDTLLIAKLGQMMMSNEIVTSLTIKNNDGDILFEAEKKDEADLIVKREQIVYRNRSVGSFQMGLSKRIYNENQIQIITIGSATVIAIILSMLAGVMLSVKRLIKKPLQEFSERIDSIAKGDYRFDTQTVYVELQGVMERFNQMALKVKHREESLVEANKRLTAEIDERKKMERLLRESEERYRSLNSNVPIGVFRNAINGKLISLNPALMQMLEIREGYDINELQAVDFYCHSADRDYLVNEIVRCGRINGFECRFKTYGGNQIWVSISARGIKDESGRITYIDGIVQNITQQKEVEAEKDRLQSQLIQVQKMEAIGTLAGGIAHDFNNILGAILGYAQLAQINSSEDPKIRKYLDQIFTASERAKELVKQILTFSRQAETEKIPVDVGVIVKEALKLLRASIPATIEIRRNVESNLGVVEADSIQIHQIVMNLCTNAFHAMEQEGGRLDVSLIPVEIEAGDAFRYHDITPGRYLKLTVADTGHGMDANTMSRIFEPYYTTKDIGMGTGMGLATVHGIVKKHGGDITVTSEQGVGTTFQVLLPVTEIKFKRDRDNATSLPQGNEKILLVDDEKSLADLGKDLLESLGYSVETRTSAHDALEAFRIQPGKYHLIITDMTMPSMHGKKLAEEIKKIRPDIPIILCTGYSTLLSSDHVMDQSISRILMKPLTVEELGRSVRKVLDEAKDSILQ